VMCDNGRRRRTAEGRSSATGDRSGAQRGSGTAVGDRGRRPG